MLSPLQSTEYNWLQHWLRMIKIAYLADYPETIPTLIHWFRVQWPDYYAERTAAEIARDFRSEANRVGLPVRLVARSDGELAGTVTLRAQVVRSSPEYYPGLGGLYVAHQYRSQGIGTELVKAGMKVAQDQGYEKIYATTVAARGILERLGWELVQEVSHGDEQLLLYLCELNERDPIQPEELSKFIDGRTDDAS